MTPSSAPEVAPFPAGLNDCVSGLRFVVAQAAELRIDPAHIVVAGESGGGNLTLATGLKLARDGDIGLIRGLYALCPYIAGRGRRTIPLVDGEQRHPDRPAQQPRARWPTASASSRPATRWPGRCSPPRTTSRTFPPTIISVNECDPLRDEGVEFYRLLLRAGVRARCRQVMGTVHGAEIFPIACPDISHETAGEHRPVLPHRVTPPATSTSVRGRRVEDETSDLVPPRASVEQYVDGLGKSGQ